METADDDFDLEACVRNIDRANAKWGQIAKVLYRDGVSTPLFSRFDLGTVTTVLLHGSDTWVVSGQ